MKHFKTYKLGNLYHRFIKGTELDKMGWTGQKLAKTLEKLGFIRLLTVQDTDIKGKFTKGTKRYIEEPGRQLSRRDFHRLVLPTIIGGMA